MRLALLVLIISASILHAGFPAALSDREAMYYEVLNKDAKLLRCTLCPKFCVLPEGETGFCRTRRNINGKLIALGYGRPCSVGIDPIEKKPFFHVLPGSKSYSIACAGCNFRCKNCQNWQISQSSPENTRNYNLPPEKVVENAVSKGCKSIAYTYSEPVVFYEYMLETAILAKEKGLLNVCHSNGFFNPEPLWKLCKYLDAANIDLKGMVPDFYRENCGGELEPVLDSLKILKEEGVWIEITNLIIPGHNDKPEQIEKLCSWIVSNLGTEVPLHLARFHPTYIMRSLAMTPVRTLEQARSIARNSGIKYVYIGNVPGHESENTVCPSCGKTVIKRSGYNITAANMKNGCCSHCGAELQGIWE